MVTTKKENTKKPIKPWHLMNEDEIRAAIANAPSREVRHENSRDTDLPIHLYLEEAIKELDDGQFDFLKPGKGV